MLKKKRRLRVDWGKEAADWLAGWINRFVQGPFYHTRIDYRSCLMEITSAPEVCALFDPSHLSASCLHEKAKRMAKVKGVLVSEL